MTAALAAAPCPACRQVVPLDPHLLSCPETSRRLEHLRAPRELGPQAWQVLRLSLPGSRGAELEQLLEESNRRARAWLQVRGRTFP